MHRAHRAHSVHRAHRGHRDRTGGARKRRTDGQGAGYLESRMHMECSRMRKGSNGVQKTKIEPERESEHSLKAMQVLSSFDIRAHVV